MPEIGQPDAPGRLPIARSGAGWRRGRAGGSREPDAARSPRAAPWPAPLPVPAWSKNCGEFLAVWVSATPSRFSVPSCFSQAAIRAAGAARQKTHLGVAVGGEQQIAGGEEGHKERSRQSARLAAGGDIPEPGGGRSHVVGRGESPAVRGKGETPHPQKLWPISDRTAQVWVWVSQRPPSSSPIASVRPSGEKATERYWGWTRERSGDGPGVGVETAHRLVVGRGGQGAAIRREGLRALMPLRKPVRVRRRCPVAASQSITLGASCGITLPGLIHLNQSQAPVTILPSGEKARCKETGEPLL